MVKDRLPVKTDDFAVGNLVSLLFMKRIIADRHFLNYKLDSLVLVVGTRRGKLYHMSSCCFLLFCFVVLFCVIPSLSRVLVLRMDLFNREEFVREPTLQVLNSLKKSELIDVAVHYKLTVETSMKKGKIKKILIDYLVDEELVPEEESSEDATK